MRRSRSHRTSLPSILGLGIAVAGGCVGVPDDQGCFTEGLTLCGGQCVDTTSDPANCGGCGVACEADVECVLGSCGDAGSGSTPVRPESCQDECEAVGLQRCGKPGDDGVLLCGDFDGDGCLEWSPSSPCGEGRICAAGRCQGDSGDGQVVPDQGADECIAPNDDCVDFDDCCDEPDQGYHCCPIFHICVPDFW